MDLNICRICLEKKRRLQSIFHCQTTFIITTFISEFCNVLILENDGYSNNICKMCLDKMSMAYDIRSRCTESDRKLRASLTLKTQESETLKEADEFLLQSHAIKSEDYEAAKTRNVQSDTNAILCLEELGNVDANFIEDEASLEIKEEEHLSDDGSHDTTREKEQVQTEKTKVKRKRKKPLEKSHMCSVCGKTFYTNGHLRSHELTHNDSKDFICHFCNKNFLKKSYLNRHMKSHLNARNYKCKECGKGFNTSTSLGYHFRLVHSGDTRFHCTFCNKAFPLKIQLVSHTRSHTGEKPNKCDQCDKKYSHKIDLKRHMMLHTGNKAYKCPYCDRTFTKKSNMECHIPTHTGEMPYKCNICFKDFRQPCPYRKHMQSHDESKDRKINAVTAQTKSSQNFSDNKTYDAKILVLP